MLSTVKNEAFFTALQSGVVPLSVGNPGLAKTASMYSFTNRVERALYVMIGSIREPSDFGIPFLDPRYTVAAQSDEMVQFQQADGTTVDKCASFVLAAPKWATDIAYDANKKWILCFDELTCCSPAVQAGFLRIIAERTVGDLVLPDGDDLWMCALANPSGTATNGFDLEPAMANRLMHLRWEMDWDAWDDGMRSGGDFPQPQFKIVPEGWQERMAQVGSMFTAFRRVKPGLFHLSEDSEGQVTVDRGTLTGAWPSPRTWYYAMRCRAAGLAAGISREAHMEMLTGCVGPAGLEYLEWEENLDLPDPETLISQARKAIDDGNKVHYDHPDRPDKVIALLSSVATAVMGDIKDDKKYNKERWEAAIRIFYEASKHEKDLAISCVKQMFKSAQGSAVMPPGATLDPVFVDELLPTVMQALGK